MMDRLNKTNLIVTMDDGVTIHEGTYEETTGTSNVLIKSIPQQHRESARTEIQGYMNCRNNKYITRYCGMTEDDDGTNIVLEEPNCNLQQLILSYKDEVSVIQEGKRASFLTRIIQEIPLWNKNGTSSPLLHKIIKDMIKGVRYLHLNKVRHRNLVPENILIFEEAWEKGMQAKLSDFGSHHSPSHSHKPFSALMVGEPLNK